ncbi:hypothetical protein, partial [Mesorhizobium sp.]|uniref:hypothetical protein n=1 Tax=Mesorhizobium sp. TaxID=1871066 RepID=UPI0025ED61E1
QVRSQTLKLRIVFPKIAIFGPMRVCRKNNGCRKNKRALPDSPSLVVFCVLDRNSALIGYFAMILDWLRTSFRDSSGPTRPSNGLDHSLCHFACECCKIDACFLGTMSTYMDHLLGAFSSH